MLPKYSNTKALSMWEGYIRVVLFQPTTLFYTNLAVKSIVLVGKVQLRIVAQKEGGVFVCFYERLKMMCDEVGKTPTGVGKELSIDRATVSYWKSGHIPKFDALVKLSDYFDVSIDYLVGRTDKRESDISQGEALEIALFRGNESDIPDDEKSEMRDEANTFLSYLKHKYNL